MNTKIRPTMIAFAFVATVAVVATGLMTFRGETKEVSVDPVCAAAAWPLIPAQCLEGASVRVVRDVTPEHASAANDVVDAGQIAMQQQFDVAFQ